MMIFKNKTLKKIILICCTILPCLSIRIKASCTKESEVPVVFAHFGSADYLKYSLSQALKYNKRVILISDTPENTHGLNIEYHDIKDYMHNVEKISEPYEKEAIPGSPHLFAHIKVWLMLANFMQQNNLDNIFYCDSDVMLYTDISKEIKNFIPYDLVLTHDTDPYTHPFKYRQWSGSTSYCTLKGLKSFCNYIEWFYTNKENWNYYSKIWNKTNIPLSEMFVLTAFVESQQAKSLIIKDLNIIINDSKFDNFISSSDSGSFTMKSILTHPKIIKDIFWNQGLPFCYNKRLDKNIRFNSIHFYIGTKNLMRDFQS